VRPGDRGASGAPGHARPRGGGARRGTRRAGPGRARGRRPRLAELRRVFDDIYRNGTWADGFAGVPLSGGGSLASVSRSVIDWTRAAVRDGRVRSIADLGCGDLTYVTEIDEVVRGAVAYIAYDIVPGLVEQHRALPWGEFHVADLTARAFRVDADLVIVKDVLFHLENDQIRRALDNLRASRWKFLITTVNTCATNEPRAFNRFHWAPLDLTLAPFHVRPAGPTRVASPSSSSATRSRSSSPPTTTRARPARSAHAVPARSRRRRPPRPRVSGRTRPGA
jgi:hypothetical protein